MGAILRSRASQANLQTMQRMRTLEGAGAEHFFVGIVTETKFSNLTTLPVFDKSLLELFVSIGSLAKQDSQEKERKWTAINIKSIGTLAIKLLVFLQKWEFAVCLFFGNFLCVPYTWLTQK